MNFNNKPSTYYILFIYVFCVFISSCKSETKLAPSEDQIAYMAKAPIIDAVVDKEWDKLEWAPIDQTWLGAALSPEDFEGKYKVAWKEDGLYVLALIKDDILIDSHEDPLQNYWDDDCLEIFVDLNGSGGNHQYNHNAFAYHISLDQDVLDMGRDSLPHFYNSNVNSAMKPLGNNEYLWEAKINMYDESYLEDTKNKIIPLKANQTFGFAIAYCDNDTSKEREHFIGSEVVEGEDKNRGWIDAGIFGKYTLVK